MGTVYGAHRYQVYYDGRTQQDGYYASGKSAGWYYDVVQLIYGPQITRESYCAGIELDGGVHLFDYIEPRAADQSRFTLTATLRNAVVPSVAVGVLTSRISSGAYARYTQLCENANILGTISPGSTSATFSLTHAQAEKAQLYGVKFFPASEFGETSSTAIPDASLVYTPINPASRGRVTDLVPGNYASIVASEDTEISYPYHHDYGGYAQAWLGVTASNQDTGKNVLITRKKAVSVPDGGRGTFTIPAGTLTAGRWTITISAAPAASADYYDDTDDFWVTGQESVYTVRENPSASGVTCDGRPVPKVEWESVSQAAYQVRFGDYDSGARSGTETSFIVPRIFRDGAYPVTVRTASSAGTWSDWTETEYVTVRNVEPVGDFSAQAGQEGPNVLVKWDSGTRLELAWEPGAISSSTGEDNNNSSTARTRIRTTEFIPVTADGLTVTVPDGMQWYVMRYSTPAAGGFISAHGWNRSSGETGALAGEYVRFVLAYTTSGTAIDPEDGQAMTAQYPQSQSAAHYAVFRDGEMIAVTDPDADQVIDRLGAGGSYEVLAVTADRYYKSSGIIAGRLKLAADLISADGGYTWLAGRLTPERKSQPEDVREDISFVYYAGREKPTAFRTGQKNRTKSFVYVFKNRTPARTLRSLVGSEVIVKTTRGEHIRGVIPEMNWGDARFVSPSFQIREVWGEEDGLEYPTE